MSNLEYSYTAEKILIKSNIKMLLELFIVALSVPTILRRETSQDLVGYASTTFKINIYLSYYCIIY